ncbi:LOW QUALITY PROTEIN: uncharacterized protein C6orf52 homolog [Rhynchocyon petersi]
MAGQGNFAGFELAQPNNHYWYWQRLNQDFQLYQAYHCGHWFGQLQGGHPLSGYSNACLEDGNGDSFLSACEVLEHSSEPSIVSKGTTALAENQDEDSLEDPNAHFNTETLNKEFMVRSEELYDSLMNCHWQPLDTVHCKIPEKPQSEAKHSFSYSLSY